MTVIDDYLKAVTPSQKVELERVRKIVKQVVPDAEETIGYGMPVFKYKGKYVIGMCAFKDHLSVFPGSEPIAALSKKLEGYKTSKGTVQFTLEKPLLDELLKEIIKHCLQAIKK